MLAGKLLWRYALHRALALPRRDRNDGVLDVLLRHLPPMLTVYHLHLRDALDVLCAPRVRPSPALLLRPGCASHTVFSRDSGMALPPLTQTVRLHIVCGRSAH
jgi:hypothetical protein